MVRLALVASFTITAMIVKTPQPELPPKVVAEIQREQDRQARSAQVKADRADAYLDALRDKQLSAYQVEMRARQLDGGVGTVWRYD